MKTLTIDIETSGLPPKNADYKTQFMEFPYIVELAYKINDEETKGFIINQEGREIPKEASDIHGITTEIANASPHLLLDVLNEMLCQATLDVNFIIGHNIFFDTSIIKANILRLKQLEKCNENFFLDFEAFLHKDKRIDTMRSSIKFCALPKSKWPKLTELYFKLFNENFEAHSSKNDVDATHKCYVELVKRGVIK